MSIGIIEVKQLTKSEIKKLDAAFGKDANLHEIIGCGRTALWRARNGKSVSIDNLNKFRTFLNNKTAA